MVGEEEKKKVVERPNKHHKPKLSLPKWP